MGRTLLFLGVGTVLVVLGFAATINPGWFRKGALRYYTGRNPIERYVPFGGNWMRTHEKEHIISIRVTGLGAIILGAFWLYAAVRHL